VQFYIVAYHVCRTNCIFGSTIDRFLINVELELSSTFTERRTYVGELGIAQFDLSFRVACLENYYGPQCNVFCSGVAGQSTCDSEGNLVCVDSSLTPESSCTECRVEGGDPDNNCIRPTGTFIRIIVHV